MGVIVGVFTAAVDFTLPDMLVAPEDFIAGGGYGIVRHRIPKCLQKLSITNVAQCRYATKTNTKYAHRNQRSDCAVNRVLIKRR